MARDVVERELTESRTSRVCFAIATEADDADIRRLLRENPMPGNISLSLEREPNYFADARLPGETKQTIVARHNGRVICLGSCTIRLRFINGEPRRVGYLGGLRLDKGVAGRFDIVRGGYEFFRKLQGDSPADFYFTSIAADNARARKLLERGLPGMPRYEFIGDFVTVLLPSKHHDSTRNARTNAVPSKEQLIALLNHHNAGRQFAPCWSAEELTALQPLGLRPENFRFVRKNGQIAASAALWDQRVFKQTVIRSYGPSLTFSRPALNLAALFTGGAKLPAEGETLANAFISHLVVEPGDSEALPGLLAELRGDAAQRGIELLTAGFAAADPRLTVLRSHFRCREYHSRLYTVRWPECGGSSPDLDGRILAPEAALL
jgi:hypothetical protein